MGRGGLGRAEEVDTEGGRRIKENGRTQGIWQRKWETGPPAGRLVQGKVEGG